MRLAMALAGPTRGRADIPTGRASPCDKAKARPESDDTFGVILQGLDWMTGRLQKIGRESFGNVARPRSTRG